MIAAIRERKQRFEDSLEGRDRQLWEMLLFLARFTAMAAPVYLLLWQGWNPVWLRSLDAQLAAILLEFLAVPAQHSGTVVSTQAIAIDVSTDSTGWKSMLALTALILAVRNITGRKRAVGIVAGLLIVFIGNLGRIVSMAFAVTIWGISYELIHTVLWRWGLTVLIFMIWLAWLRWADSSWGS